MVNHNANINKAKLTETDIITKFIMPAVKNAGWDDMTQIRQEVKLCDGKVIEAKANKHEVGKGIQQAFDYANLLDVTFVFPPLEEHNEPSPNSMN